MDPTNKFKGTKKTTSQKRKALMDDVIQSEEGTTTTPEDSELPEVDTMEEIVRKRKEEELSLRFAEPGSKNLYLVGLEIKIEGNLAWATSIVLDIQILGAVDQPVPADALVLTSTSVPDVPAPTQETAPATSVATSSSPSVELGIPAYGMRLIRLAKAKVTQMIEEFSSYVKESIETTVAPHKENLEAVREEKKSIKAQLQGNDIHANVKGSELSDSFSGVELTKKTTEMPEKFP
ncbi:hypothetical protein K7X08_016963 [Anisodus acutangulus]|uniref:Uncharacterized protein n=1 Tax=Anisodus acutangulus TaxID=402998 RepID=A0A9Q1LTS9_9SOLA|nr:hypothetical protein K7X08_016963 [Anisodus acutangulus]